MDFNLAFVATACLGAAVQEVAHWYELRDKLGEESVRVVAKSSAYWFITALMCLSSGVGVWFLFGEKGIGITAQFIAGASFPLILKKAISAFSSEKKSSFNGDSHINSESDMSSKRPHVRKYFELYSFGRV